MNKIYRILGKRGRTTIPHAIRVKLGLRHNDLISFEEDGDTVIVRREKVCDECDDFLDDIDEIGEDSDALLDFVDNLSDKERMTLFFYLLNNKVNNGGFSYGSTLH